MDRIVEKKVAEKEYEYLYLGESWWCVREGSNVYIYILKR